MAIHYENQVLQLEQVGGGDLAAAAAAAAAAEGEREDAAEGFRGGHGACADM